jgi:dihydrofolate reductase
MGRKTFESIGCPLARRHNLVVTRDLTWRADGIEVVTSLDVALVRARVVAEADGAGEVMVIGGAEIYRQVRPLADVLYLTRVELAPEGDAFFELPSPSEWVCEESIPAEEDGVAYRLERYQRRR